MSSDNEAMASSRPASPMSADGPSSPGELTPRSKVRAMLASLDDSDDEVEKPASAPKLNTSPSKRKDNAPIEEEEDEDEDEPVQPRGRLAARMQAASGAPIDKQSTKDDARERVRKMIEDSKKAPPPSKSASPTAAPSDDDDDDDIIATPTRRRKPRKSPVQSPASSAGTPRPVTAANSPASSKHRSPGIFVTPGSDRTSSPRHNDADSDSDSLPVQPVRSAKFLALVEKKRQERLQREAEIERQKALRLSMRQATRSSDGQDELAESEEEAGRKLTQQSRPGRKASKRALEEMHRETQRLSRNMQLAHEARTKKKITKASLFARFNYKPAGSTDGQSTEDPQPLNSSSPVRSARETPPTSPDAHVDGKKDGMQEAQHDWLNESTIEDDLPSLEDVLADMPSKQRSLDKGKGKAVETDEPEVIDLKPNSKIPIFKHGNIRIHPPKFTDNPITLGSDSDSDLEIVSDEAHKKKLPGRLDSVFDRVPAKKATESHSLHALRMLAHLQSPGNESRGKNTKSSMTTSELQQSLQRRAREQAVREREERLQELRAKGIHVQTAEERAKEMAEVEDLVAKARKEADEIMQREKEAAKRERKANGEEDPLGESSDEEWEEGNDDVDMLSMSGSEDVENGDDDDAGSEEGDAGEEEEEDAADVKTGEGANLFVEQASETEEEHEDSVAEDEDVQLGDAEEDIETPIPRHRRRKNKQIISDDEDEVDDSTPLPLAKKTTQTLHTDSPKAPSSVLRSATKNFIPGLPVQGVAGLGLTQIFQGTMDSQASEFEEHPEATKDASQRMDTEQDSLAFLRQLPRPSLPSFAPTAEDSPEVIKDSQVPRESQNPGTQTQSEETQGVRLDFTQTQVHEFDSLQNPFASQYSDRLEPTQDMGFEIRSPIMSRYTAPPSTVDTVMMDRDATQRVEESPVVMHKGRLRRRVRAATFSDDEEEPQPQVEDEDFEITSNVFDVMRKAAKQKKHVEEFDKKKSNAKTMVHEQAEESEDEYAGLGGASDDDSGDENDADVREMIDDEAGKEADQRQIAAFFADKERANDEKQVQKLYRDITNGMLRRKRGADYSLSDSDDDGEARRRRKRKEFAKMRKALLADERIGKIAENPKRLAFLRAIEDRDDEDEMDFLDERVEEEESQSQSQSESQNADAMQVPNSQPDTSMPPPPKRKRQDSDQVPARPPPHMRRTQGGKRPSNLSEIRESLSSLIEEPNVEIADSYPDGDSEESDNDDQDGHASEGVPEKENRGSFAPRRRPGSTSVVDRISLKREGSSNTTSNSTKLAFAVPSANTGFKVPALLRRATTNNSMVSDASNGSTSTAHRSVNGGISAGGFGDETKIKRGGGKNSGVNAFKRDSERRKVVEESEKRRAEKRFKGAEGRRKLVGEFFGGGKFE